MRQSAAAILGLLFVAASFSRAQDPGPPRVGAIRWDGWYGDGKVVRAVEAALTPPKYHFRLPWFARVAADGSVRINGDDAAVMAREIDFAAEAGLDYWAFVDYGDEASEMHRALNHYRKVGDKRGIRYCFVEEGARLDAAGRAAWPRLVAHFRDPHYQTVLDGRPLLFLFVQTRVLAKADWDDLRRQTREAGQKDPYLVLMGWNPAEDARRMAELGFDAISAYARGGSYSMTQPDYATQCALVRRDHWERTLALGVPSVTFASAGWDTRPRNERPPFWMKDIAATPDATPFHLQPREPDAVTATPEQLAGHVRESLEWTRRHPESNPANTVILYGWNEHDEGGWVQPTLGADGQPDTRRIQALGAVLRPVRPAREPAVTSP